MTPKACPCGIHPADCAYHSEAYERHAEHPFWGRAYVTPELRAEIDALVKQIQESHAAMMRKVQKP